MFLMLETIPQSWTGKQPGCVVIKRFLPIIINIILILEHLYYFCKK